MTSNSGINSDAANGLIYGVLTSGIFGVILYIFGCFYTLVIIIKYHLSRNKKKYFYKLCICFAINCNVKVIN